MIEKISHTYFRLLSLTILMAAGYLIYTTVIDLSDEISDTNQQLESIAKIRNDLASVSLLKRQLRADGGGSVSRKLKITNPGEFLPLVNSILQGSKCKMISAETANAQSSRESISIELKLTIQCRYADWIVFRKKLAEINCRVDFMDIDITSTARHDLIVIERIKLTKFLNE